MLSMVLIVCSAAAGTPRYTTFAVPQGSNTRAFGINTFGQVVGRYIDPAGVAQAFFRNTDGSIKTLSAPGGGSGNVGAGHQ